MSIDAHRWLMTAPQAPMERAAFAAAQVTDRGFKHHIVATEQRDAAPRNHAPIMRGNLAFAMAPRIVEATPQPKAQLEEVVIPMSERVTIMELRESMCRWPLGDPASPDFRYCGADSPIGDGPYCKYHARVAYQPAQDRRRARIR